ncbi:MAG TPA: DNA gyrase inhibitor YacG [Terriglobales bacterium]|nr:DNA gyrase inhibitor YacG [Terriglobales bacterium]
MPRKRSIKVRCPICRKFVKIGDPEFPFCSERCRTIDLGKWASGGYVISSPVQDTDDSADEFMSGESPDNTKR